MSDNFLLSHRDHQTSLTGSIQEEKEKSQSDDFLASKMKSQSCVVMRDHNYSLPTMSPLLLTTPPHSSNFSRPEQNMAASNITPDGDGNQQTRPKMISILKKKTTSTIYTSNISTSNISSGSEPDRLAGQNMAASSLRSITPEVQHGGTGRDHNLLESSTNRGSTEVGLTPSLTPSKTESWQELLESIQMKTEQYEEGEEGNPQPDLQISEASFVKEEQTEFCGGEQ